MKFLPPHRIALVLGLCTLVQPCFGQGSLTPPGAPTPTMKTLDQIASTGIAINATNTPGDGGNLYIISAPGSYYLTGNVTGVSGKRGILITAINVTVDLNGFRLTGVPGSGTGISDGGVNLSNAVVRNGSVYGWGNSGVNLAASASSVIRDLIVSSNGQVGVITGDYCHVRDCIVQSNGLSDIQTGSNANITHCTAVGSAGGSGFDLGQNGAISGCVAGFNGVNGIRAADGCVVRDCVMASNSSNNLQTGLHTNVNHCTALGSVFGCGFNVDAESALAGCVANLNKQVGIIVGASSSISQCTTNQNSGPGILVDNNSNVVNCSASLNGVGSITAGIQAGTGCTVSQCVASGNNAQFAISVLAGSTVIQCTASGNSASQAISAGISAPACLVKDCTTIANTNTNATASNTTGMGIYCNGNNSLIESCTSAGNKGDGIWVNVGSTVKDNVSGNNATGAGVHAIGGNNRIDGNQVTANDVGIRVDTTVNLVLRNTARSNSPNYSIVLGNRVATIVVPTPTTTDISGNTGGSAFSTDASANIAY